MTARHTYQLLAIGLLLSALLGLFIGAYEVSWDTLFSSAEKAGQSSDKYVLLQIRLPRLALAMLTGAGLAAVGAALQGMFRNPLAEAGLIGVSSGAMLFAACAIVLAPTLLPSSSPAWLTHGAVILGAFSGALATTLAVYRIGVSNGQVQVGLMLLAGVAIASFAAALTGYLIYLSDDNQLRDLTFWTLGSLSGATWWQVGMLTPVVGVGLYVLRKQAMTLNAIGLGEKEAELLGLDVTRCKNKIIISSALIVGASIAFTGLIGFVGLVVPHMLRLAVGSDFRKLIPMSALLGAGFLSLTDTLARITVAPAELPIGILTALIGAPFFIWLLVRQRKALSL